MNNKIYPVAYNKNHYTVMANDIVKGKQAMTLQEARIIRLLITQVVKEDKDLKTYTCRIQDLANYLNIDKSNIYRDIKNICSSLLKQTVKIGTGNLKEPWREFQWMDEASYDGNGNIKLELSNKIKPYVIDLEKYFTQYQFKSILQMQSFYAIRLYELLKCEDGFNRESKSFFEFSINELREFFCCENKYKTTAVFINKTIKVAIREINDYSDLWINPETIKTGRTITSMRFYLHDGEFMRSHYET